MNDSNAQPPLALADLVERLLTPRARRGVASAIVWETRSIQTTRAGDVVVWSSGTGPTVLLVHGWESSHIDMDAFVAPLLASGHRVVTFDLPAHGESDGATSTMLEAAAAVADIGARFGPLTGIIAHSFGCPSSAIAIASGLAVERVVLVASPAYYEKFVRATAASAGYEGDALVAAFAERGVDVTTLDMPQTAAEIAVPALIFHSADDRIVDIRFGETVAKAWRGSTFVALEGLGHSRILRDPDVVRRAAAFIAGTE